MLLSYTQILLYFISKILLVPLHLIFRVVVSSNVFPTLVPLQCNDRGPNFGMMRYALEIFESQEESELKAFVNNSSIFSFVVAALAWSILYITSKPQHSWFFAELLMIYYVTFLSITIMIGSMHFAAIMADTVPLEGLLSCNV